MNKKGYTKKTITVSERMAAFIVRQQDPNVPPQLVIEYLMWDTENPDELSPAKPHMARQETLTLWEGATVGDALKVLKEYRPSGLSALKTKLRQVEEQLVTEEKKSKALQKRLDEYEKPANLEDKNIIT